MNERKAFSINGLPMLLLYLLVLAAIVALLVHAVAPPPPRGGQLAVALVLLPLWMIFTARSFFTVPPNRGRVMQLFGRYVGTVRHEGLRWTNPFYSKRSVSLRVRNFESGKLKVNDRDGNPIEIAAVVVWKVVDTAEAMFAVDDYEDFVHIQSESALRQMAQSYPYDSHDDAAPSLRGHGDAITEHLRREIHDRLLQAGVEVIEARISHLAYAQEIAQAMLQRQQANAIVAARERIVEGAVGMVGMALEQLRQQGVVELDGERRAAMVSNLLVVLCGDRATQPVVNAGSLYH